MKKTEITVTAILAAKPKELKGTRNDSLIHAAIHAQKMIWRAQYCRQLRGIFLLNLLTSGGQKTFDIFANLCVRCALCGEIVRIWGQKSSPLTLFAC